MAAYDRARFGTWIDADGDGCDTRAELKWGLTADEAEVEALRNMLRDCSA